VHTASRIASLQEDVINNALVNQRTELLFAELIVSYGFDGSTGQGGSYNQAYGNKRSSDADSCLFATTVMPLRLIDSSRNFCWTIAPHSL